MNTPSDAGRGQPPGRRGSASPAGKRRLEVGVRGVRRPPTGGCVVVVVAVVAGVVWADKKLDEFNDYTTIPSRQTPQTGTASRTWRTARTAVESATLTSSSTFRLERGDGARASCPSTRAWSVHARSRSAPTDAPRGRGQTRLADGRRRAKRLREQTVWGRNVRQQGAHPRRARPARGGGRLQPRRHAAGDGVRRRHGAGGTRKRRSAQGPFRRVLVRGSSPDGSRLVTGSGRRTLPALLKSAAGELADDRNRGRTAGRTQGRRRRHLRTVQSRREARPGAAEGRVLDVGRGHRRRSRRRAASTCSTPCPARRPPGREPLVVGYDNWVTVRDLTTGADTHRLRTKPTSRRTSPPGGCCAWRSARTGRGSLGGGATAPSGCGS